jgi:hypothetical protein
MITSWSWALIEKPPVRQLLKNFPIIYGTRRFITVFTRTLHWSLFSASWIQSTPPILSKINSNIIHPTTSSFSYWPLSFWLSHWLQTKEEKPRKEVQWKGVFAAQFDPLHYPISISSTYLKNYSIWCNELQGQISAGPWMQGARGSVDVWGTTLQAGRLLIRFPMWSLNLKVGLNIPAALWNWDRLSL